MVLAMVASFLAMTASYVSLGALPVTGPTPHFLARPKLRLSRLAVHMGGRPAIPLSELPTLGALLDSTNAVFIGVDDDVLYDDLVRVVDTCRGAGVEHVAVGP